MSYGHGSFPILVIVLFLKIYEMAISMPPRPWVATTKGDTFTANSQKLEDSDHRVTVSAESGGNPIVYDSFMGAMNSVYIQGHTIGTPESGMPAMQSTSGMPPLSRSRLAMIAPFS